MVIEKDYDRKKKLERHSSREASSSGGGDSFLKKKVLEKFLVKMKDSLKGRNLQFMND